MIVQELRLTIFNIGEEEYGLDIMRVVQILRIQKVTRLPKSPYFIEGVINLRGKVIPIIDLRKRFGLKASHGKNERILLTSMGDEVVGLIVDGVKEVLSLSRGDIEPPPSMVKGIRTEYLHGVGKAGERLIIILNIDRILSTEERITLKDLSAKGLEKGAESG